MHGLYQLVTGPLAWISFLLFIGGSLYRLISMANLARKKDPVVFEYMSPPHALRSILHWITPFATTNWRAKPVFTVVTFAFHICLVLVPVFLFAHVLMWKEAWNVSWFYLPDGVADIMTLIVIAGCIFFLVRRISQPDVAYLTTTSDYVILAVVAAPFVTGFWCYHQWPAYKLMMTLHMLSGEIMLAAIPFTRLSHMLFFPFTRGYMGSEFGAVRHAKDW